VIRWPIFYELIVWAITKGKETAFRGFIIELAGLQPGEAVLDVGCGTGTLGLLAKKLVDNTGRLALCRSRPATCRLCPIITMRCGKWAARADLK